MGKRRRSTKRGKTGAKRVKKHLVVQEAIATSSAEAAALLPVVATPNVLLSDVTTSKASESLNTSESACAAALVTPSESSEVVRQHKRRWTTIVDTLLSAFNTPHVTSHSRRTFAQAEERRIQLLYEDQTDDDETMEMAKQESAWACSPATRGTCHVCGKLDTAPLVRIAVSECAAYDVAPTKNTHIVWKVTQTLVFGKDPNYLQIPPHGPNEWFLSDVCTLCVRSYRWTVLMYNYYRYGHEISNLSGGQRGFDADMVARYCPCVDDDEDEELETCPDVMSALCADCLLLGKLPTYSEHILQVLLDTLLIPDRSTCGLPVPPLLQLVAQYIGPLKQFVV